MLKSDLRWLVGLFRPEKSETATIKNQIGNLQAKRMSVVANILGYVMVVMWGVSFYPPLVINYRLQSCPGVSVDFVNLNQIGYLTLVQSMFMQYFSPALESHLTVFDLVYCAHGLVLNVVMFSQVALGDLWPWRFAQYAPKRMKKPYLRVLQCALVFWAACTVKFLVHQTGSLMAYCNQLYLVKISLSLIKYIPQFLHNRERQSMQGYSMAATYCDLTGGIASLAQLVLLNVPVDDNSTSLAFGSTVVKTVFNLEFVQNNFGKLGISLVTILFQSAFICQSFLYASRDKDTKKHGEPLYKRPLARTRSSKTGKQQPKFSTLETIIELA